MTGDGVGSEDKRTNQFISEWRGHSHKGTGILATTAAVGDTQTDRMDRPFQIVLLNDARNSDFSCEDIDSVVVSLCDFSRDTDMASRRFEYTGRKPKEAWLSHDQRGSLRRLV